MFDLILLCIVLHAVDGSLFKERKEGGEEIERMNTGNLHTHGTQEIHMLVWEMDRPVGQ